MRESINCLNQLINNNTFYFEVIMLVTTIIIIPYIIRLTSVNHKLRTYSRIIIIQKLVQYVESSIFHKKELDEIFFILKKGKLIASAKFNPNSFESYFNKQKVRNSNYKRTELEQEVNLLKDLSTFLSSTISVYNTHIKKENLDEIIKLIYKIDTFNIIFKQNYKSIDLEKYTKKENPIIGYSEYFAVQEELMTLLKSLTKNFTIQKQ